LGTATNKNLVDFVGDGETHAFFRTGTGVHYFSPDFNGFSFKASYMVDSTKTASNNNMVVPGAGTKEISELGVSADYAPADMPFYLGAAYQNRKNGNGVLPVGKGFGGTQTFAPNAGGPGSTDTVGLIGGGVKFGDLKVGLWLEQAKWKTDGVVTGLSEAKRNALWIPVTYTLPTGTLGASFLRAGELKGTNQGGSFSGNDTAAQAIQVSYTHNLSKQTQGHVAWQYISTDKYSLYGGQYGATQNQVVFLLRHSF
jgi:predicted porin